MAVALVRAVAIATLLVVVPTSASWSGTTSFRTPVLDPDAPRMIVAFRELPEDARSRFADVGVTHAALFRSVDAAAIVGPSSAYRTIARWHDVVGMTPDAPLRLYMWQANQTTRVDLVRGGVKPLRSAYTGRGVTVAVVDTGIDSTHPDLAGNKVVAHLDFTPSRIFDPTTPQPTDADSWDPVIREPVTRPVGADDTMPFGHGTFMAGAVGGTGAAARGEDMRGVAPEAKLVDLDVGDHFAYTSSIIAAFEWLLQHRDDAAFPGGIRVAVGGWGADCDLVCEMPVLRRLLGRVIDAGIVVVLPAGPAVDGDITYPARYPEMIAVRGACKDQDDWSGFCGADRTMSAGAPEGLGSFSASIDIVAPAVAVWTPLAPQGRWQGFNPVWFDSPVPGQGNTEHELNNRSWYGLVVSHSVATAQVAGIAALMVEANPDLGHVGVERILQKTARDLGPGGFDPSSGFGMADAFRAVKAAERSKTG